MSSLWVLAILVGIFFFVNTHPIRPHDFWWHMAVGREIHNTAEVPTVDVYSYTMAGQLYPSYQSFWLMELFLFWLYSLGGPALVVFSHGLLITSAYSVLLWVSWQVSGSPRAAALGVFLAAALGFNDWNVRPQAITFLLGALFLAAIHGYRKSQRLAWLGVFPLGMLIWVNSHGTFLIGLVLLGLWLGDELWQVWRTRSGERNFRKPLVPLASLVVTSLACLINPSGPGIIHYFRTMAVNPVVQNLVPEWAPPMIGSLQGVLFYLVLLLSLALVLLSPRRLSFFELAAFVVFAGLSLGTSRGIIWFGLILAPIIAAQLSARKVSGDRTARRSAGSPVINASILAILALMALLSLPWFKESLPWRGVKAGLVSGETPVGATDYMLEKRLPGQLFHAMPFGSYLIWAAQPEYPVFVDSRIELYPPEIWKDYLEISQAAPDWESRLEEYGVNTLMLSPADQAGLVEAAQASSEWEQVYLDAAAIVFVRRNP